MYQAFIFVLVTIELTRLYRPETNIFANNNIMSDIHPTMNIGQHTYTYNNACTYASTYEGIFWKRVLRAVDVEWNNTSFNNYDVTIKAFSRLINSAKKTPDDSMK